MLKDPDTEASAAKAREHLIAFVEEMVAGMAHVRQRTNALLYVRGLIEHGGRKSLQPTLLRLGEDAACYESVQQFLAVYTGNFPNPSDPPITLLFYYCCIFCMH